MVQCSSAPNIPAVGDCFCMDLDGDTHLGYYQREATDTDADMQALTIVTCVVPYDCDDDNDTTIEF